MQRDPWLDTLSVSYGQALISRLALIMSKTEKTSRINRLVAAVLLPGTFFVVLPLVVYLTNLQSVSISKYAILGVGGAATLVVAIFLWLLLSLRMVGCWALLVAESFALAILMGILFPNRTGEAAGFQTDLAAVGNWMPLTKLGIVFIVLLVLGFWHRIQMHVACTWILLCLCALVCFSVLGFDSNADRARRGAHVEALEPFQLGRKRNIIVLVLDGFTGYRMLEICKERPDLEGRLAGFEVYPHAIASAHNTPAGNSAILTGTLKYAINIDDLGARNAASVEDSFLIDAKNLGWGVTYISKFDGKVGGLAPLGESALATIRPLSIREFGVEYASFLDVSAYRILPRFCGRAGSDLVSCFISALMPNSSPQTAALSPQQKQPIEGKMAYERFVDNLSVGNSDYRLVYYLSEISHPPWSFTESGEVREDAGWESSSRYSAWAVVALTDKLKKLGVWDDTMVIVTADHGCVPLVDPKMGLHLPYGSSMPPEYNPLIMVRRFGSNKPLRVSDMPAWIGDVAATVRDALGVGPTIDPMYTTRSLLGSEDGNRRLKLPVFFRPETDGYHGPLKKWIRLEVEGQFEDFVLATSPDVNQMLAKGGRIVLRAGVDRYSTDLVANGWLAGSETQYHALIEVSGRTAGVVANEGVVVLTNENGRFSIRQFSNPAEALMHINQLTKETAIFAAGVQVPRSVMEAAWDQARFGEISDNGKTLNFLITCNGKGSGYQGAAVSADDCIRAVALER